MRQHPVRDLLAFAMFFPEEAKHPALHIALAMHAKDGELTLARFLLAHPGKAPPDSLRSIFEEVAALPLEGIPPLEEILAEVQQLAPAKPKKRRYDPRRSVRQVRIDEAMARARVDGSDE